MKPLISIVMASYNGEKYLRHQLDSLLAQDYPLLEFVCVDDASTDNSWSILQEYKAKDPRLTIIQQSSNQGYVATFEKGIHTATGELIALADQDDIWVPSKISKLFDALGQASLVYSDSELIDAQGKKMNQKMSQIKKQIAYNSPLMYTFGAWAPGHSMLFKREILDTALPFSNYVTHDYLLGFAATCHEGINYLPIPLVQYRQHETNAIGADLKKSKKNYHSRQERNHRICERLKILADRCPTSKDKKIFEHVHRHFSGSSLFDRIQRVALVFSHRNTMLAYKGKSAFGNFIYPFKLLFGIY
jgi:glycosyltransferase involved in cell wall biosynthesis